MKYLNFISRNVKIAFKIFNNLIRSISYKNEKKLQINLVSILIVVVYIHQHIVVIHFTLERMVKVSKFETTNIF